MKLWHFRFRAVAPQGHQMIWTFRGIWRIKVWTPGGRWKGSIVHTHRQWDSGLVRWRMRLLCPLLFHTEMPFGIAFFDFPQLVKSILQMQQCVCPFPWPSCERNDIFSVLLFSCLPWLTCIISLPFILQFNISCNVHIFFLRWLKNKQIRKIKEIPKLTHIYKLVVIKL